ncbi:Aste57867_20200 [Aphanomyces stellatus]|uniref:Aste57867_20200 protein n=1 Tax=Aphanomyces stellatus TaxID=120398 RepID=A0A485LEL3_9STRA|nr:hypothetical protein As57867_020134 [Aphanomyces stellatus]VFT96894.1 Aste57867_20200 [Aphanomyces stellatus]
MADAKVKKTHKGSGDDDEEDEDMVGGFDSSGSLNSRSSGTDIGRRSMTLRPRSSDGHKSDGSNKSSSALSLPNSFDEATPMSTPAVSPAPARLRTFDAELSRSRPSPLQTLPPAATISGASSSRVNDAMRKFYELQVGKIRAELAAALDEKALAQRTLASARSAFQETMTNVQTRFRNEVTKLKSDKTTAEAQVAALERRLKAEKTHFSDLRVSDALAQEFQRQDREALTLVEYIHMRVYELIQPHAAAADRAAKDLEKLKATHAETATARDELEHALREAKRQADRAALECKASELARREAEKQVGVLEAALQERTDSHMRSAADAKWEDRIAAVEMDLKRALVARDGLELEKEALAQQVQLLTTDKAYLVQEKDASMEKVHKLASQLDDVVANARRLELSRETFVEQVAQAREESRVLFEHRMQVELTKLQDASRKEMDVIRESGKQMYERENRLLRDARTDSVAHIDHLQNKLAALQHAYEDKVLELTRMDAKWATDVAELRNDVKMKHFELAQLGRNYEEKATMLHQAHLESEMLKQKVEVHKTEFAKLEASTTNRMAQLELALAFERDRLKSYDQLEVDMDNAILQSGAMTDEASATFAMIPTAPKRRFQQSVALAQKVVQYEQQMQTLQKQLDVLIQEKEQLSVELTTARHQVSHMHQPQQYLVDKLRFRDNEVQALQSQLDQVQEAYARQQRETQDQLQAKLGLQNQLQQLVNRRQDLDALKQLVLKTTQQHAEIAKARPIEPTENVGAPEPSIPKWYMKLRHQQAPPPT